MGRTVAEISQAQKILRALEFRKALVEADGHPSDAAKIVGISRTMFFRVIRWDNQRLEKEAREHGYV